MTGHLTLPDILITVRRLPDSNMVQSDVQVSNSMSEMTGLTLTDAALKRLRIHEWVLSCVHPVHHMQGLRRRLAD